MSALRPCDTGLSRGAPQPMLLQRHSPAQTLQGGSPASVWDLRPPGPDPAVSSVTSTVSPLQPPDTACSGITMPLTVLDPLPGPLSPQGMPTHPPTATAPFCLPRCWHQGLGPAIEAALSRMEQGLLLQPGPRDPPESLIRRLQPRNHPLPEVY